MNSLKQIYDKVMRRLFGKTYYVDEKQTFRMALQRCKSGRGDTIIFRVKAGKFDTFQVIGKNRINFIGKYE